MSSPVLTYGCTTCDLRAYDAVAWGARRYKHQDATALLRASIGWCDDCADIGPVEKLPDEQDEHDLKRRRDLLLAELAPQLARHEARRGWFRKPRKPDAVFDLEYRIRVLEDDLVEIRDRRALLATRLSGPRCLVCGGLNSVALPPSPVEAESRPSDTAAVGLGVVHPHCGGELTVRCDGTRLRIGFSDVPQTYDIEGRERQ